jgi:hypothetical protein
MNNKICVLAVTLLLAMVFFSGYYFPRFYIVSYVYHTESNPAAGYGQMMASGRPRSLDDVHEAAWANELQVREDFELEDKLKSLAILSISPI